MAMSMIEMQLNTFVNKQICLFYKFNRQQD